MKKNTRNIIIIIIILFLLYYFFIMKKENGRSSGTAVCCNDQMLNYDADGMTDPNKYCDSTVCESTQEPPAGARTFNNIY